MPKDLRYYQSKIKTLSSAMAEVLREMETELKKEDETKIPRTRQNKREERKLDFKAMYSKQKFKQ